MAKKPQSTSTPYPISEDKESYPISDRTLEEYVYDDIASKRNTLPNLAKQAGASVTDIALGIPGLAGMIGAGAQAGWNALDPDVDFPDAWGEAIKSGVDADLMKASWDARQGVNKAFGIEEPFSKAEQVARFGLFFPNPVSLGTSAASKAGHLAMNLLTPVVKKTTPMGIAGRWGAQGSINLGLETVMRSLHEDRYRPPITKLFDDEQETTVSAGTDRLTLEEYVARERATPSGMDTGENPTLERIVRRDIDVKKDEAIERERNKRNLLLAGVSVVGVLTGLGVRQHRAGKFKEALGPTGEAPFGRPRPEPTLADRLVGLNADGSSSMSTAIAASRELATRAKAANLDSLEYIRMVARVSLKNQGKSDDEIIKILNEATAQGETTQNSAGIANRFFLDGIFGQDTNLRVDKSLTKLQAERNAMPEAERIALDQGMIATSAIAARALGAAKHLADQGDEAFALLWSTRNLSNIMKALEKRPGGLERNLHRVGTKAFKEGKDLGMKSNEELLQLSRSLFSNAKHKAFINSIKQITDQTLEYAVKRGTLTEAMKKEWRAQVTYKDMPMYVPTGEVGEMSTFMNKMGDMLGGGLTSTSHEMYEVAEWGMRGLQEGRGIMVPRNPMDATAMYVFHVIDHVNRSKAELNFLHHIAPMAEEISGAAAVQRYIPAQDSGLPRYLGYNDPNVLTDPGRTAFKGVNEIHGKVVDQKAFDILKAGDPKLTALDVLEASDEVMWVQHGGKFHAWHVPLKEMREALRYQPLIAKKLYTAGPKFFKDTFTQFTTGLGSAFAPISWTYNTQLQAVIRTMHSIEAGKGFAQNIRNMMLEPIRTNVDAVRGSWAIWSQRMAEDKAQQLLASAGRRTGEDAAKMTQRAEILMKKYENSMLSLMEREGGMFATGYGAQEFGKSKSLLDLTKHNAPDIRRALEGTDNLSANMSRYWRYYKYLNEAFHGGSATGYATRLMKNSKLDKHGIPTAKTTRLSIKTARDYTGDVRRVGGGFFAREVLTPNVPFFGAMVQSWNAMGMAMHKVGWQKAVGSLTAAVGMPTIMEVVYNNSLPSSDDFLFQDPNDPNKKWSYRDYYWNGFTTSQRVNNSIVFIPGRPPWEAVLVPIFPELALMRAMIIEPLDALFGFSNIPGSPSELNNGDHLLASADRVLDFPIPPYIGATLAAMSTDAKLSVGTDEPESILSLFDIGTSRVRPQAEFIFSGTRSRELIDDAFDEETVAIFSELAGSGAHAYFEIVQAFEAGSRQDIGTALSFAGGAALEEFKRQARWTQPLFGKALHPTLSTETSKMVFNKKNELQHLAGADLTKLAGQGGIVSRDGKPAQGNAIIPPGDPIVGQLAIAADAQMKRLQPMQDSINTIRTRIKQIRASSTWDELDGRGPQQLTYKSMIDKVDTMTRQINLLQTTQLSILEDFEEDISGRLTKYYGRDVHIKLDRFSEETPALDIGAGKFADRRRRQMDRSFAGQGSLLTSPTPK